MEDKFSVEPRESILDLIRRLMLRLEAGDVVLTASTGKLPVLIRWATQSKGEEPTYVNHAEQCVKGGLMYDAIIVGALATVKRRTLWEGYGQDMNTRVAIFRPVFAQPPEITAVCSVAESHVGNPYGPLKLPLHLLDRFVGRVLFWRKNKRDPLVFRRLARLKHFPICSGLVALSWYKGAGIRLGGPWWGVSPDDLWDHFKLNPHRWEMVLDLTYLRDIASGKVRP